METTIPCPIWCQHALGHEYEDDTRHHERNVLTVPAESFGDPYDVNVEVVSTEQVTMSLDGVEVTSSPVVWVNAENLKTYDARGFDLDPKQARCLAEALHKAASRLRGRSQSQRLDTS
jgi:hypothetical protein